MTRWPRWLRPPALASVPPRQRIMPVLDTPSLARKPVTRAMVEMAQMMPSDEERRQHKMQPFKFPQYAPGVLPNKQTQLAMDAANTQIQNVFGWTQGYHGMFAEGIGFFGYPYLAELSQREEYRRASEVIAEEMTRKWLKLVATSDKDKSDKIKIINDRMKDLKVRELFQQSLLNDGLYGQSMLFIDVGADKDARLNDDEMQSPLLIRKEKIGRGMLQGFKVIDPMWIAPNNYDSADPTAPNFYVPQQWFVMGRLFNSTRLIQFNSRPLPDILKPAYNFGGLSLSQMMKPYVDNWLRTRQSVSDLINSFTVWIVKMDLMGRLQPRMDSTGQAETESLKNRLDLFTLLRNNRGVAAINKETEDITNVSAPLGGLDHLQAQAQEHLASITGIPLVKYLGITPSGLNASADSEIRCFYDMINARQQKVCDDAFRTVLNVIQLDEFGEIDPDIHHEWIPLWQLDEAGRAAVRKTDADTAAVLIETGVIDADDERKRQASAEDTLYPGLEGPAPGPPDTGGEMGEGLNEDPAERIDNRGAEGSTSGANSGDQAFDDAGEFVEAQHPRGNPGNAGQFKKTGGAAEGHITPAKHRAWQGRAIDTVASLSKLETGAIGERVVISYLKSIGFEDAKPLNSRVTNFPVDLIGDHHLIEVKTGLVSNGPSAQQWRATIGQPGKAESEWLRTASAEEKAKWNAAKKEAIMQRKMQALAEFKETHRAEMTPQTITTILNPDTKTADVFVFSGFHHRIAWNSPEARDAYVGSFSFGGTGAAGSDRGVRGGARGIRGRSNGADGGARA